MRLRPLLVLVFATLLPGTAIPGTNDGIAVVVADSGPDLNFGPSTLRDVFLKRIVIDRKGRLLVPVNLSPKHPLRRAFSSALLARSPDELQSYWNNRYFQGVSPPFVVASQEAMIRFVATTPGAIGYVAACNVDARVRVILRLPNARLGDTELGDTCPSQ